MGLDLYRKIVIPKEALKRIAHTLKHMFDGFKKARCNNMVFRLRMFKDDYGIGVGYISNGVYIRFDSLFYRTYNPPKGKTKRVKAVLKLIQHTPHITRRYNRTR